MTQKDAGKGQTVLEKPEGSWGSPSTVRTTGHPPFIAEFEQKSREGRPSEANHADLSARMFVLCAGEVLAGKPDEQPKSNSLNLRGRRVGAPWCVHTHTNKYMLKKNVFS